MTEAWTCPFCALLCDRYTVARTTPLALSGSDCPRANAALRHFDATASTATATIGGLPVALDAALDAAAEVLRKSRQPLFGGLATDVDGQRALYRLATRCSAIVDHAHGDAMQHGQRALQDRGQFTTTLAEIRERADLIVCFGTQPGNGFPEFWHRVAGTALRRVVFVGSAADPRLPPSDGVAIDAVDAAADLYATLALLNALVAQRPLPAPPPLAIATLAQQLSAARYAVLVWEAGVLDAHGALFVEALQRLVGELNRNTRAASFALGGNDGALTAQQVFTWLSGLPLRTRVSRDGLAHDPLHFGTSRLLADRAVDALLWVSSFGPEPAPPRTQLPSVVLGHPALAAACTADGAVFIPISTPGIGSGGHLFRADVVVALPLQPLYDDTLPRVASVVAALLGRLA